MSQKKASLLSTLKGFYASGMMHPTTGQVSCGDTETERDEAIETEHPLENSQVRDCLWMNVNTSYDCCVCLVQVEQMCPENTGTEGKRVHL